MLALPIVLTVRFGALPGAVPADPIMTRKRPVELALRSILAVDAPSIWFNDSEPIAPPPLPPPMPADSDRIDARSTALTATLPAWIELVPAPRIVAVRSLSIELIDSASPAALPVETTIGSATEKICDPP